MYKKRNVLLLTISLDNMGPSKKFQYLAKELTKYKLNVHFGYMQKTNNFDKITELTRCGIKLRNFDLEYLLSIKGLFRLIRYLNDEQIDILITRLYRADFYGRLAACVAGTRYCISNIVDEYTNNFRQIHGKVKGDVLQFIDRFSFFATDLFVTNSFGVADNLSRIVRKERILTIHDGIDLGDVRSNNREVYRRRFGLTESDFVLGTIARLYKKKRIDILIEAVALLRMRTIKCFIIGDGEEKNNLISLAQKRGVECQFQFLGEREDVKELLQMIDVFVLPSLHEGLPGAIMEAMACRKPVVATNVTGNKDLIVNNLTGYLVSKENTRTLAGAIVKFVKEPQLIKYFGAKGYERYVKHFTVEQMGHKFANMINENLI